MSNLEELARPAVDELLQRNEDDLYTELGARLKAMGRDPALSASFAPQIDTGLESLEAMEDFKDFGKRFFDRVNVNAYDLVCGQDSENAGERQKVIDAFSFGKEAVAAAMAAFFVAQLGLAPAVAAVVAAIAISIFFRSAHQAMCGVWKEHLPQNPD
jgi:hypothetical protein